jgi:hypothetical protein
MTKQLLKYWFLAVMILIPLCAALAQAPAETPVGEAANSSWSLRNAQGDIILSRDGRRTALQGGSSRAQGILLGARDMVQTGRGSAELQLQSAGEPAVVNLSLSENTSVVLDKLDDGIVLELLYGRLALQSGKAITVRSGNSSVFFGNCDAVIEYAARPGIAQPSLVIRCLEGEGELTAQAAAETGGVVFPIRGPEMLSLEYRVPFAYVERKSLESVSAEARTAPAAVPVTVPASVSGSRSHKIRTGNTIAGILLVGAGVVMQGYSFFANPRPELKDRLFYGGYAPLTLGAAFLLGAVFDSGLHGAD